MAGCRWFTIEKAREHWGAKYNNREIGDSYIRLIDFIEQEAKMLGWIDD